MGQLLFPLGLGTALSLMGDATLYTVLPTHTQEVGVAFVSVGILLGVNRAVRVVSNGLVGLFYDHWPRRWLFVPALFLGALSTALYAATRGFWALFVARLLWGIAWSGIWVGGATMILDLAPARERGRWTGLYQTWFFVGAALGALSGGVLTDVLGFRLAMWIGAAITACGGVVALVLLPETRGARDGADAAASGISGARPGPPPSEASRFAPRLWTNRALWLVLALHGVNRFVVAGILSATLGLVVESWARSAGAGLGVATLTGLLMAARTLLSMASAPLAGSISDRAGSRWKVVAWGLGAGAVGVAALALDGPAPVLVGVVVVAIARGTIQSLTTALTGDLAAVSQRGRAIGALHTVGDIGSAVGPAVAYGLLPRLGLGGVYLLGASLFAVGLVSVWRFAVQGHWRTRWVSVSGDGC